MPGNRDTTTLTPGIIWIPPQFNSAYAIKIQRTDGTIDDVSQLISSSEVEDTVTDGIGRFTLEVWNPYDTFTDKWKPMDIFYYYKDYAVSATTLRFRGRLEKISYVGQKIRITGRSDALKLMGKTVTQSYSANECSLILKSLIDLYGTGFTYTNVLPSLTTLTVNWYQKPFWECVQELCKAARGANDNVFECYVDSSLDFNFFESGTRENTDEGIVHTHNLIEISDFADDSSQLKNRVILYGADQGGIKTLYTSQDVSSQTSYGVREEIINDSNVTTRDQAKDLADYKLEQLQNSPSVGELRGMLLATIQPGQKIVLSSPADKIYPGLYPIVSYVDRISDKGDFFTTVRITNEPRKFTNIIKSNIENAYKSQDMTQNPYEMRDSYNFLFDSSSGTHSGTQITDGVLKLLGADLGTWISPARTTSTNVISCYLYMVGDTLSGASVYVSSDGSSYDLISNKTKVNITNPGTSLSIKIIISNTNTKVDSLSLLYKNA